MNRTSRSSLVLAVATICMFFLIGSVASAFQITATPGSAAGAGGRISPEGAVTVLAGQIQTFVILPASGYKIASLTVDKGTPQEISVQECDDEIDMCWIPDSYAFTNVTSNHTIEATFLSTAPAAADTRTVTVSAGANGSISPSSPSGTVPVLDGQDQLFVINPNPGYKIASLIVDDNTVGQECDEDSGACGFPNTYILTNVTNNLRSIAATFVSTEPTAVAPHAITVTVGANGSISPSGDGIPKIVPVIDGQSQTFVILPDSGYKIASLTVDGGTSVQECDDELDVCWFPGSYTFTNVTADHTIDVAFEPTGATAPTYRTITVNAGTGGRISPSGEAQQPGDPMTVSVNDGQNQTFVILPDSGYKIASLTVDGGTSVQECDDELDVCWFPGSYTFTNVTADHMIDVTFETTGITDPSLLSYRTIAVTVGAGGSISPPGVADPADPGAPKTVSVVDGGDQMFYINPEPGYKIASLVADGIPELPVEDDESGASALPNTYTFTGVTDNTRTLEVTFAPTLPAPPTIRTITASAVAIGGGPTEGGVISPSGDVPVIDGQSQLFVITPNPGCQLDSLTVGDYPVDQVCDEESGACGLPTTYVFAEVHTDGSIVATFTEPPATYTVTASVVGGVGGTISYSVNAYPDGKEWDEGAQPTYFFSPAAGYKVAEVCVGTDPCMPGPLPSYTFAPLTADTSITVEFEAVPITYSITASAGTGGAIAPSGTSYVSYNGSLMYKFNPMPYYEVADVKINNVSIGPMDSYEFTLVQKNQKISVSFTRPIYTMTSSVEAGLGTISYSSAPKLVYAGTNLTYTVKPGTGYIVDKVVVDDNDSNPVTLIKNQYTFTAITDNHNIKAYFKLKP